MEVVAGMMAAAVVILEGEISKRASFDALIFSARSGSRDELWLFCSWGRVLGSGLSITANWKNDFSRNDSSILLYLHWAVLFGRLTG